MNIIKFILYTLSVPLMIHPFGWIVLIIHLFTGFLSDDEN